MSDRLFLSFFLSGAALVAGCPGSEMAAPDAGPSTDGGTSDMVAPSVRDTTPASGSVDVPRSAEIVLRFSEPMNPVVGTITVSPGGSTRRAADATWEPAGNVMTLRPGTPWPSGEVTLAFGADFTDVAGNTLAPYTLVFTALDDVAPTVTATTPAEGAGAVSARADRIDITFDEPMRTALGTIDLLGGAGTVGAATWSADAATASFPVTDLEYERDYQVVLRRFADAVGNAFDGEPLLGDGVIDFSTGFDLEGPRVVRSEPAEGQLDVNPADAASILVTFDEAMDTSRAMVRLSDGSSDVPLTGIWTASARILRVDVAGLLSFGRSYALDLSMLRDRSGNALEGAPYLVDGALDFAVGLDAFLPFVGASSPAEAETDVPYVDVGEITVAFSEAMDPSVSSVPLTIAGVSVDVPVRWTTPTSLVANVLGRLRAGAPTTLDLRSLEDLTGNTLDAGHRYLGDGRLDFTTSAPAGDGCRDPLTIAEATVTGDSATWTISSIAGATRDGGTAACDANGASANGADVLVRFDKISDTVAAGGRYLEITLDGGSGTSTTYPYDVAVMAGAVCDPLAVPASCQSNAPFQDTFLDLPPGPVWIWVARALLSTSAVTVTLTVTEVAPPRVEGDSCDAPFTAASTIYTPPSAGDPIHHFAIPANVLRSIDITRTTNVLPNTFACDTAVGHGIDGVVRFDKPDDASVLRVSARRTSGTDTLNFGVFDTCDPSGARVLGCATNVSTTASAPLLLDVPRGPVYLWVADTTTAVSRLSSVWQTNAGVTVDIEVVPDVEVGELCSRAITATDGPNAVGRTSDARLEPPTCFAGTSNIEWYRIRATRDVLFVTADAGGFVALVDPATHLELACSGDTSSAPLTRVVPVGSDICIAVDVDSGIGALSIAQVAYGGLGSRAPVELAILPPLQAAGTVEESVAGDFWLAATSSLLVMRHISSAVLDVGRAGGERAVRRGTVDGVTSTVLGRTGVASGGGIFSFSTTTSTTSSRLTRLWDGRSAFWTPTTWDLTPAYVPNAVQAAAADGASDIVYVTDGAVPSFYRVSTLAPSTPVLLGTNAMLSAVRGLTLDDQFFYVSATVMGFRGIFRVPRASIGASPSLLALSNSFSTSTSQATPMAVDAASSPRHLYVRNQDGEVEAILEPSTAAPVYLGPVITRGRAGDWAMTLDVATGQLFLFETETNAAGVWLRYDP